MNLGPLSNCAGLFLALGDLFLLSLQKLADLTLYFLLIKLQSKVAGEVIKLIHVGVLKKIQVDKIRIFLLLFSLPLNDIWQDWLICHEMIRILF